MPYPSYTGTPCHTQATQVLQLMCRLTQLYKFSVLAQRESSCERSMEHLSRIFLLNHKTVFVFVF